eukprot:TRINITY_DN302_c1_g1_i3.p1 TRINITY_DN302_c1_g1~~TRINITY_DN302_c1_g1_i3.p1  ORF type:complete len:434 (-),score=73.12 TRINITY_DN302_c1_g1_i3:1008-2309(-)
MTSSSSLMFNPFQLSGPSSIEKTQYMAKFDVEKWYEQMEAETFKTTFIPLTLGMGQSFVHHFQQYALDRKGSFTEVDQRNILLMTELIDTVIQNEMNGSAFVRLSTRSPKDAALSNTDNFRKLVFEELKTLNGGETEPSNEQELANNRLRAICKAGNHIMKISNGDEAMKLLLDSERIFRDLLNTLECYGKRETTTNENNNTTNNENNENNNIDQVIMNVIIREFVPIDPELEFRGFVFHRKLTALSQYNDMLYYPFDKDFVFQIISSICSYWETISHKVPFDMCIVDFVILPSRGESAVKLSVKVVEINPFGLVTGSSLFNWSEREDRLLIQGGEDFFGDLKIATERESEEPNSQEVSTESFYTISHPSWPSVSFRMNQSIPSRVRMEYVHALFGDVFETSDETSTTTSTTAHTQSEKRQQREEPKKQCSVM